MVSQQLPVSTSINLSLKAVVFSVKKTIKKIQMHLCIYLGQRRSLISALTRKCS